MIIGKLPYRSDLLRELNKVANTHDIRGGIVQVMGGVSRARLSYYDQQKRAYQILDFDAPHEIVSGTGNISMRDDTPFVHIHLAVAGRDGKVIGGHCLDGCTVFAVEYVMWPFTGEAPRRVHDSATGLYLWEKEIYTEP